MSIWSHGESERQLPRPFPKTKETVSCPSVYCRYQKTFLKTRRPGRHTWNRKQLTVTAPELTSQRGECPPHPCSLPQESSPTKTTLCSFCRISDSFPVPSGNQSRAVALECPSYQGCKEEGMGTGSHCHLETQGWAFATGGPCVCLYPSKAGA